MTRWFCSQIKTRCHSPTLSPPPFRHRSLCSLHLPRWSRTPVSVDARVGHIHQSGRANGINRWQWSSAPQTMAHKHPVTSGQMQCGGFCVCVCLCVCEWIGQRKAATRGEVELRRKMSLPPRRWCAGETSTLGHSSNLSGLPLRVQFSSFPSLPSAVSLFSPVLTDGLLQP